MPHECLRVLERTGACPATRVNDDPSLHSYQHPAVQKADEEWKEAKAKLGVRKGMRKHARRHKLARTSRVHSAHAGLVRITSPLFHFAPPRARSHEQDIEAKKQSYMDVMQR